MLRSNKAYNRRKSLGNFNKIICFELTHTQRMSLTNAVHYLNTRKIGYVKNRWYRWTEGLNFINLSLSLTDGIYVINSISWPCQRKPG